jgi:ubiquinone/menaquinone biosynthesis C-methylase UbiE
MMVNKELFDEWPERYDAWFTTPIGKLVKEVEAELINNLLVLRSIDRVLDVGCGTGIFTINFLATGAQVVGLDISSPMLSLARKKTKGYAFFPVRGDMRHLPFRDNSFDKVVSVTTLEFTMEAMIVVNELFRVTKPGGVVVVATLNSLSPWATRRRAKTLSGQRHILENAVFRSPDELLACSSFLGIVKTAVHFQKEDDPAEAIIIEQRGQSQKLNTGAFVAVSWEKP